MNLNSIHSYKKKTKLNQHTIITEGKQPHTQSQPHSNNLQVRNQRYLQIHHNHPNIKTAPNHLHTIAHSNPSKHSSSSSKPTNRQLETAQKLINAQDDHELMHILRNKFADDIPDEISGLVLNNKFKAQNLNMNINIHYNAMKDNHKMKVFDEQLVIKKSLKHSQKIDSLNYESEEHLNNPSVDDYPTKIPQHKNSFHLTTFHKHPIAGYEQIYGKRPCYPKAKRAKTEKTGLKSINSKHLEHDISHHSTLNPFHWQNYYKKRNRYVMEEETGEGSYRQDGQECYGEVRDKYKSLDLRGNVRGKNTDGIECKEQEDAGTKMFTLNTKARLSAQAPHATQYKLKASSKPRRILTQQGSKDQRKTIYASIDFNELNQLKKAKEKAQSKLTARNNHLAKDTVTTSKDAKFDVKKDKSPLLKDKNIFKTIAKQTNLREQQSLKRLRKSQQKQKKASISYQTETKHLGHDLLKRHDIKNKRYGPSRRYNQQGEQEMPNGIKSYECQFADRVGESGWVGDRREWTEDKWESELGKQIKQLSGLVAERRLIADMGIEGRLVRDKRLLLIAQSEKQPSQTQASKKSTKQHQLSSIQNQLEANLSQTYRRLSLNRQLAINYVLIKLASDLQSILKYEQINTESKRIGLALHQKLFTILEQQQSIRLKEQAGYYVHKKPEQAFLGLSSQLFFRLLAFLTKLKNSLPSKIQPSPKQQPKSILFISKTITTKLHYLISLQFLQLLNNQPATHKQLNKQIIQICLNMFTVLHNEQNTKTSSLHTNQNIKTSSLQTDQNINTSPPAISLQILATTGVFYVVKELGVVNEKLGKLNRAIEEVNAFAEVNMFRESQKDDFMVKVSTQSQEFVCLVEYLKNSMEQKSLDNQTSQGSKQLITEISNTEFNKLSQSYCRMSQKVTQRLSRTNPNKQSYLIEKISLTMDIETQLSQLISQSTTPRRKGSLHRVLMQVKLIQLSLRRKLTQWCLNHKCERERIVQAIEEYLRVSEQVSSLIGQSELFISVTKKHPEIAANSNNKQPQKSMNKTKYNSDMLIQPHVKQLQCKWLVSAISSICELITPHTFQPRFSCEPKSSCQTKPCQTKSYLNEFYLSTCQQQSLGETHLLKAYLMYLNKNHHQCQIYTQQSLPKTQLPYLTKLLSLLIALKLTQNNFYQAHHLLERLPYHGVFLDQVNIPQTLTNYLMQDQGQNVQTAKYQFTEGEINQNQKNHMNADESLIELKCLELFCTGVVLLMKKKLQQGLNKLTHCHHILQPSTHNQLLNSFKITTHNFTHLLFPSLLPLLLTTLHSYLAYAYYCLDLTPQAEHSLSLQLAILHQSDTSKQVELPPNFPTTVSYNYQLCLGLIAIKRKDYPQAINHLNDCLKILNKPEPHAYLALTYFSLHQLQTQPTHQEATPSSSTHLQPIPHQSLSLSPHLQDMYIHLTLACSLVQQMNNNFASSIFYLRALYYAWTAKLDLALLDVDQAIDKAEQNYAKHFYLRGLILACSQNYRQAINQTSIAISINQKYHDAFLLRSRCCQIQADQNQAFMDLQTYITLRPDDLQIHKYAGHLLFQNGAFQDAISAYQQGQHTPQAKTRQLDESDFHVFLTRSKTYFLLGKFAQAAQCMKIAAQMKPKEAGYHFDYQMIKLLDELTGIFREEFKNVQIEHSQHQLANKKTVGSFLSQKLQQKLAQIDSIYGNSKKTATNTNSNTLIIKQLSANTTNLTPLPTQSPQQPPPIPSTSYPHGKIFKQVQYHMLRFCILFYLQRYKQACIQVNNCIAIKQVNVQNQHQNKMCHDNAEFEEEDNEKELFVNQMKFNLCLVNLKMKKFLHAQQALLQCSVQRQSKTYPQHQRLMSLICNQGKDAALNPLQQHSPYIKVYSDKNKLSKFFPQLSFPFQSQNYTLTKLLKPCLPYPKVEPPQITPRFDIQMLNAFTQSDIDKKPQAPWIKNEKNSIKFTEEIKTFSRLDIEHSQTESRRVKKPLGKGNRMREDSDDGDNSEHPGDFKDNDNEFKGQHMIKKRSSQFKPSFQKNQQSSCSQYSSDFSASCQKRQLQKILKLDDQVELKLKKLMKKQSNQ